MTFKPTPSYLSSVHQWLLDDLVKYHDMIKPELKNPKTPQRKKISKAVAKSLAKIYDLVEKEKNKILKMY